VQSYAQIWILSSCRPSLDTMLDCNMQEEITHAK
jgi:hypothetical protein